MLRKKKEPGWEELLDSLVNEYAAPDNYYAKARESIRAYVKDLELKVEELEARKERHVLLGEDVTVAAYRGMQA